MSLDIDVKLPVAIAYKLESIIVILLFIKMGIIWNRIQIAHA